MSDDLTWSVRRAGANELNLVRNSSFLSAQDANEHYRSMGKRVFARYFSSCMDDILAKLPDIFVADAEGVVLGWGMGAPMDDGRYALVYVYSKAAYRKRGVALSLVAALLEEAGEREVVSAHWSDRHGARIKRVVDEVVPLDEVAR